MNHMLAQNIPFHTLSLSLFLSIPVKLPRARCDIALMPPPSLPPPYDFSHVILWVVALLCSLFHICFRKVKRSCPWCSNIFLTLLIHRRLDVGQRHPSPFYSTHAAHADFLNPHTLARFAHPGQKGRPGTFWSDRRHAGVKEFSGCSGPCTSQLLLLLLL